MAFPNELLDDFDPFHDNDPPSTDISTPSLNDLQQYDIIIRERTETVEKRRQVVRESETKRRKRIKGAFDELKELVIDTKTNKRVTQEDIIQEAVKKLKEMKALLEEKKAENDKLSPSVSNQIQTKLQTVAIASPNWSIGNDIDTEEAAYAFPSMAYSMRMQVKSVREIGGLSSLWGDCVKLYNLAERTKDPFFIVQSLLLLHGAYLNSESEPFKYMGEAVKAMQSLPPQQRSHFILDGESIVPNTFMMYGVVLAVLGKYEEGEQIWQQGTQLALHDPTKTPRLIHLLMKVLYSVTRGKQWTMKDAEEVWRMTRLHPVYSKWGECSWAVAQANSDNYDEQLQGIASIEKFLEEHEKTLENFVYAWAAPVVLNAYLRLGLADRGLEVANKALITMRKAGLLTTVVLPELLRVKSELLAIKVTSTSSPSPDILDEIKESIIEATNLADRGKVLGTKLRVAITGYTLSSKISSMNRYAPQARDILQDTYNAVLKENGGKQNYSRDIQTAHELLNEDKPFL